MTKKLYRIKPLVWVEQYPETFPDNFSAIGCGGYEITKRDDGTWYWQYCYDEYYDECSEDCESLEDGKAKCEAHRIERLERDLEVVE